MKLTKEEALAALRALYRTAAYHNVATAEAGKYVASTGVVPDWLVKMTENTSKWYVKHCGYVYQTSAKTRADAVNNVRWNIYGKTPLEDCGEFDAINPAYVIMDAIGAARREINRKVPRDLFGKKITKQDALARIRRMAS